jgi:hypothetical protein
MWVNEGLRADGIPEEQIRVLFIDSWDILTLFYLHENHLLGNG